MHTPLHRLTYLRTVFSEQREGMRRRHWEGEEEEGNEGADGDLKARRQVCGRASTYLRVFVRVLMTFITFAPLLGSSSVESGRRGGRYCV
jgi:hypothetical protein